MSGDFKKLPALDKLLGWPAVEALASSYGNTATKAAARDALGDVRAAIAGGAQADELVANNRLAAEIETRLVRRFSPSLRPVFNLTGTVIHTNLGRAILPEPVIEEIAAAAGRPTNLEFNLATGRRGDRDSHVEDQVCRLTGAEASTVVNNNAAAVLLVLNTLARRREVLVSRGELVEIGGAFRIPDVMARAGAKLREVGTTNRTHLRDFADAVSERTALIMKVHTSNYEVQGFTTAVPETALAALTREHGLPFVVDLGSGMLVDLERYGLPHERTAQETLADGADLVTFSGDKLLGGPQAGIIAGRADLVAKIKKNPMKRALRLDKLVIAALSATLRLYEAPERLREAVPVLRLLTRPLPEIEATAAAVAPPLQSVFGDAAEVAVADCHSQIGSGALPVDLLPSRAVVIHPPAGKGGGWLNRLAAAFRSLPTPVIGRVADGALWLDLRCLEDADTFIAQLDALDVPGERR